MKARLSANIVNLRSSPNSSAFQKICSKITKMEEFFNKVSRSSNSKNRYPLIMEERVFKELKKFFRMVDKEYSQSKKGDELIKLKRIFRETLGKYFFQSKLIKYGYAKPRGYPGDSAILERMYNKSPVTGGGLGLIFDKYLLQNNYVQAVRDRKNFMKEFLLGYFRKHALDKIAVLNIACGSCREIRDLLEQKPVFLNQIEFFLVDQDPLTLQYAKERIGKFDTTIKFNFVQDNIAFYFQRRKELRRKFGIIDLVYSIGLADYLPDSILVPLIKFCFNILRVDGTCVMAFKNTEEIPATAPDWICDWKFVERSEQEVRSLVTISLALETYKQQIIFEKSRLIFYVILKKLNRIK